MSRPRNLTSEEISAMNELHADLFWLKEQEEVKDGLFHELYEKYLIVMKATMDSTGRE